MQRAGIGQDLAAQSAMARLQEQMMARGMLGQQLGGMRGQDLGAAGMGMQGQIAQQQARQAALDQLARMASDQLHAGIAYEGQRGGDLNAFNSTMMGGFGTAGSIAEANTNRDWNRASQIIHAVLGGAATASEIASSHGSTQKEPPANDYSNYPGP
jgi:hypothetical protein